MSDRPLATRRAFLRSAAVAGATLAGVTASQPGAAQTSGGEQEWAFETDDWVHSSPTVVDGTVCVGSRDGNLYAVDAGVSGSNERPRTTLGTLGHHSDWRYPGQSIATS